MKANVGIVDGLLKFSDQCLDQTAAQESDKMLAVVLSKRSRCLLPVNASGKKDQFTVANYFSCPIICFLIRSSFLYYLS